ncbi:MAG: FAD-dependent thymidylate synthase [Actinobacteria bacterium]|nr:FAD-dependent thymidylate synthase [Actinomycetota bacterium]
MWLPPLVCTAGAAPVWLPVGDSVDVIAALRTQGAAVDRHQLTAAEQELLAPFVSNTDRDVFVLRNLPEVTKGAVFARYSRSPKPLRRLLVDEFGEDLAEGAGPAAGTGGERAERMYQRVFVEYGDDSVAQLGGAHVALEQISNVATKIVERGRLAAYLEQSTRYMAYDDKLGGRYRYHRPAELADHPLAASYAATLDGVFDAYAAALPVARTWLARQHPRDDDTSERAWQASINAKACDLLRGLLPAATTSNVGMYASGQAYEQLLLRLEAHDLAEARDLGAHLLRELRTVIPAFLARVDRPDRGGRWARYLADTRAETRRVADELLVDMTPDATQPEVALVDFDSEAEDDVLVGMLYPHAHVSEHALRRRVALMTAGERVALVRAYVGGRTNRRHRPGRALERARYRFDICGDYGAFRDLQRHRMCTIEWQELSCRHGYDTPAELDACGLRDTWADTLEQQAQLWQALTEELPRVAPYAVGFAWRVRYSIQLNARAAMHLLELRTAPQGHASYRRVAQQMHRLIAEHAGHRAIAEMMRFVDHADPQLGRLDAERRTDARRALSRS